MAAALRLDDDPVEIVNADLAPLTAAADRVLRIDEDPPWLLHVGPPYLVFRYHIVRVWRLPVETFLNGGLGILPLAPLGAVGEADLPGVIAHMEQRIGQEATLKVAGVLWTAAVLMGLRYPRNLVAHLLQGVHGMKKSVTYQAIVEQGVEKGVIKGAQNVLLRQGQEVRRP